MVGVGDILDWVIQESLSKELAFDTSMRNRSQPTGRSE